MDNMQRVYYLRIDPKYIYLRIVKKYKIVEDCQKKMNMVRVGVISSFI